ncbi:MAG: hypothetical protein K2J00_05300 [Bacteroidaceae bacterium]|nr:hypothetical protein [Bacteroidaceae bacterium]
MRLFHIFIIIASVSAMSACGGFSVEEQASKVLERARLHLTDGRYDAARDSILSMRRRFPTALETRAQGILLLDSVEMVAARDSMGGATGEEWKRLSVKARFFERKLQEDHMKLNK